MDYKQKYEELKQRNIMLIETIDNLNKTHDEIMKSYAIRLDTIYKLIKQEEVYGRFTI